MVYCLRVIIDEKINTSHHQSGLAIPSLSLFEGLEEDPFVTIRDGCILASSLDAVGADLLHRRFDIRV